MRRPLRATLSIVDQPTGQDVQVSDNVQNGTSAARGSYRHGITDPVSGIRYPASSIVPRATLRAMRRELLSKQTSEIQGMFGRIAHRYDLLNRTLSLGRDVSWRRAVARRVAAIDDPLVLDVCTGTGDLALTVGDGVIGADFLFAHARTGAAPRRCGCSNRCLCALLMPCGCRLQRPRSMS